MNDINNAFLSRVSRLSYPGAISDPAVVNDVLRKICEAQIMLEADFQNKVDSMVASMTFSNEVLATKADVNHTHPISDIINLQVTLNGKAAVSHTHLLSDILGLVTALAAKQNLIPTGTALQYLKGDLSLGTFPLIPPDLTSEVAKRPTVYIGGVQKTNVKLFAKNATTTGGVATFYLTDNGLASGNALFTNVLDETIDFEVNDPSNGYRFGWSLSNDKKTLTCTARQQAPVTILGISLLGGLNPTPNGTVVRVTLWGE